MPISLKPACRILVVDDAPSVRDALRWVLEEDGSFLLVGQAGDGLSAVRQAAELHPDLVLLDIELPKLDGYAAARRMKAQPSPPRIIFLTVHTDELSRQRAAAAGGDGFVEKGAGWAALLAEMRRLAAPDA